MGFIRVQQHFLGPTRFGWTERFYINGSSTLVSGTNPALALRVARRQLLAAGVQDNGMTLHDEDLPGSSLAFPPSDLPAGANAYNPAFDTDDPDYAWTDLLVGIDLADPLYRGRMFMGGLEDVVTFTKNRTIPDPDFVTAFRAWEAIAQNGNYATKVLNRSVANPLQVVNSLVVNPPSSKFTWNVPAHGYITGDVIKYYKVFGQSSLANKSRNYSGTSSITVIDVNNFYVDNFYNLAQFVYTRGGAVRKATYLLQTWIDVFQLRVVDKKRGVGRLPPRGRARTQGRRV